MIVNVCASTAGGSTRLPTYYYETTSTQQRKSSVSTPEKKVVEKKEDKVPKSKDAPRKSRMFIKIKNFFRSKSVQ